MLDISKVEDLDVTLAIKTLEEMRPIYESSEDIHKHTRFLGPRCRDVFFKLDTQYIISDLANKTIENICAEILKFAGNDQTVLTVLNIIKTSSGIEPETGLDVKDLLIRTWSLACQYPEIKNIKELIIDNLKHNLATGGGCLAGISARLTQPYCELIRIILLNAQREKEHFNRQLRQSLKQSSRSSSSWQENDYDDELRLALANSMQTLKEDEIRRQPSSASSSSSQGVFFSRTTEPRSLMLRQGEPEEVIRQKILGELVSDQIMVVFSLSETNKKKFFDFAKIHKEARVRRIYLEDLQLQDIGERENWSILQLK